MEALGGERLVLSVETKHDMIDSAWHCVIQSGLCAVLHVPEIWNCHIARASSVTVKDFTVAWRDEVIQIEVGPMKGGALLIHPSVSKGPLRCAEFFAGITGWSQALEAFGVEPVVLVERDTCVANACAQQVKCDVITEVFPDRSLKNEVSGPVIVNGCVRDPKIWMGMGILNVAHGFASPPCQPWSGAGSELGLSSEDGKVFSDLLRLAGDFHMISLIVENVPGISKSADYQKLLTTAALDGMRFLCAGVHSCARVLPLYRGRWFASFCHSSVYIDSDDMTAAGLISLSADAVGAALPGPCLKASDAVHPPSSKFDRSVLVAGDEVFAMLNRSDLDPKWMASKINWSMQNPVINARIITSDMKLVGVVAQYGSQHLLPIDHLKAKGLQAMLYKDEGSLRFFDPWEILAALGFSPSVVISGNLKEAYHQVGNAISPVHAWIQIAKTHTLLGKMTMLPVACDVIQTLQKILDRAIKLSAFTPVLRGDFAILVTWFL